MFVTEVPKGPQGFSDPMLEYIAAQNVPYREEAAILAASQHLPESRYLMPRAQLRLLTTLVHFSGAETVLEIGTYTGGSTLAMARGLRNGGKIITMDINHDNYRDYGAEHVAAAGFSDRIELQTGEALPMMEKMLERMEEADEPGCIDGLLVDADKESYTKYLEIGIPLVRSGGFVLMDNAYGIGGGVVDEERLKNDSRVQGVSEANDFMRGQFEGGVLHSAFVTIGDGLIIASKR